MKTIIRAGKIPKITPCLWFDKNAQEAAEFYVSIFGRNSKIERITYYGDAGSAASGRPAGSVMTVTFKIAGQQFMALNGGPHFKFTEAVSLIVNCDTQKEIDSVWKKLCYGGGKEVQCGWLKDKYGLSWQVVPSAMGKMMTDKDHRKSDRVMAAVLEMKKISLAGLKQAYAGR
jgi:predicted 3-demethylubiquinone-9 3-methyltransferase (glyoxalase superfamily)